MADFDFELTGLSSLEETIDDLEDDWTTQQKWITGTAVEYAIYLEFGTRYMDPKPFVRPALHAYETFFESSFELDTGRSLDSIESADELVRLVAFGLEVRIKRIITKKGLIVTGTLRASVRAFPGHDPSQLLTAADVDPGARKDVQIEVGV